MMPALFSLDDVLRDLPVGLARLRAERDLRDIVASYQKAARVVRSKNPGAIAARIDWCNKVASASARLANLLRDGPGPTRAAVLCDITQKPAALISDLIEIAASANRLTHDRPARRPRKAPLHILLNKLVLWHEQHKKKTPGITTGPKSDAPRGPFFKLVREIVTTSGCENITDIALGQAIKRKLKEIKEARTRDKSPAKQK